MLIISFIFITFGVTDGQVIVSPEFRGVSKCVGRLQVYKNDIETNESLLAFYQTQVRTRTLRNKTMNVEGNCCWEVFRRRKHMSTVTWMSSSDGFVSLDHPVRSVLKKECYE